MRKILAMALAVLIFCTGTAIAATEEEIRQSVDGGLAWLAAQQKADGSWYGGGGDRDIGATGLALLKFEEYAKEQGYKPTDPAYKYSDNVTRGLKFLDSHVMNTPVGTGYDGNSNGNMTYLDGFHRTYVTGIAAMAYSGNPDTPSDLVQDLTDWLVNAQCTDAAATFYGGWYYEGFSCWSADNSNSGYATLGLGYALNFGATIPAGTTTALSAYVNFIQNDPGPADNGTEDDPDGGSGYTDPTYWVNSLKTGNLIFEAVLSGDAADSPRILNAADYIDRHWNDDVEGWKGNLSAPTPYSTQYQATYTVMKGLEAIGLEELNGKDWFDEMSTVIVNDQQADGRWAGCPNYVWSGGWGASIATNELCTAWALLTLEKVTPIKPTTVGLDVKPNSCPNPINVDSNGVLPVAIAGSENFNVTDIDPSTVMLGVFNKTTNTIENPIAPIRYTYEDVTEPYIPMENEPCCMRNMPDGIMDFSMKFDTQALVASDLGSHIGEEGVYLGVVGKTLDGKEFSGKDCVVVLESKGGK